MSSNLMQIFVWFNFLVQMIVVYYFLSNILETRFNKVTTLLLYAVATVGVRLFTDFLVDHFYKNQVFILTINLLWYGIISVTLFKVKNVLHNLLIVEGTIILIEIVAVIVMLIMTGVFGINIMADYNVSNYNFEYLVAAPTVTMVWFPLFEFIYYLVAKRNRSTYKSKVLTVFFLYQLILTFVLFLNFFNDDEHIVIVATLTVTFAIIINVVIVAFINAYDDSREIALKHEEANKLKEEEILFYQQTCEQIEAFRKVRHDSINNLNVIKNMSKNGYSKDDVNNMIDSIIYKI